MFLIRNVCQKDLGDLYELSSFEKLINLPNNRKQLETKIQNSLESFKNPSEEKSKNHYVFVLEDLTSSKVVGVSMIHGQHGTEEDPHFFFRVSTEKKFSSMMNIEFSHDVLELDYEVNGYSEIGGLILHPDYRGHPSKLGKQLSFSRFLYIALNRKFFTHTIHTELLPPLNKEGCPPFWEAIGKKLTHMNYDEADRLSRVNKEFILSLFPWQDRIYKSLLSVEAGDAIGQVSPNTKPVKVMLEKIGFRYTGEVDPFDGGPHYRCQRDDILPVKQTQNIRLECSNTLDTMKTYLMLIKKDDYEFCCIFVEGKLERSTFYILQPLAKKYSIDDGLETFCTLL